jgi:hypothetical protein
MENSRDATAATPQMPTTHEGTAGVSAARAGLFKLMAGNEPSCRVSTRLGLVDDLTKLAGVELFQLFVPALELLECLHDRLSHLLVRDL